MGKDEALRRLRKHAGVIRGMGATALYLFGSTARDEAGEASDLDLFVDYDHDSRFSAIELLRIKHYLSDAPPQMAFIPSSSTSWWVQRNGWF